LEEAGSRIFDGLEGFLESTYDTSIDNVIESLYSPLLKQSVSYVRAAGFFRSSVFRLMTDDLLDFAINGGKMTLITSLHVDKNDYDVVMDSIRNDNKVAKERLLEEILGMRENDEMVPATDMLAALICSGCLSIRIGLRRSGIYHRKKGYFEDSAGNIVLFMGSGNETRTALDSVFDEGSAEDFSVYRNWGDAGGAWESHGKRHFEKLQDEISEGPEHRFPIVPIEDLDREDFHFIEGEDWLDLENHRNSSKERSSRLRKVHDKYIQASTVESNNKETKETGEIILRPHQKEGLMKWEENGNIGILEHATGSGKTITALSKIAEHARAGLPVLILVPGKILLNQWIEEISKFMPNETINFLPVGGGHNEWREEISIYADHTRYESLRRITVAIIHSARTKTFLSKVGRLKSALVVVDECHRIGAPSFSKICGWEPKKVLGLSATPERYGDAEGTARMKSLCGDVIHTYGLREALRDGFLTPYVYNIERVSLNDGEKFDYDERMAKIVRQMNIYRKKNGEVSWKSLPQGLKTAIIQAKRIIKKAKEKTSACVRIISENYGKTGEQENWLVYCEDSAQLEEVKVELEALGKIQIYEYWSNADGAQFEEGEMEFADQETLRLWEKIGGVMLSIACLDEGVSIERISHGIILASSNNPRQFIQRRGRMLRLHDDKPLARIWDTLVIPESEEGGEHTNYVLNEVNRASIFSQDAIGGSARIELSNIRFQLGLTDHFAEGEVDGSIEADEDE
jgi:superfamily II DNA or RNA helicase